MLKKAVSITALTALLAGTTTVSLAAPPSSTQTFEVSLTQYHYGYAENIGDSEKAWLSGIHLSYKRQNQDTKQYWRVVYDQTKQNTDYNGAIYNLQTNTSTPAQGVTNNKITNTEITFANPVSATSNEYMYTGIGLHNWNRNLTGNAGYLERYSWNYIPIGYRSECKINDKWDGAFDIAVRFMFNGKMNTAYNGGATTVGDHFKLGNKPGFRAELPFTYTINSQWSMLITPWYEYSSIGQSNILSDGFCEPNSATHQYGVNLGVSYKF